MQNELTEADRYQFLFKSVITEAIKLYVNDRAEFLRLFDENKKNSTDGTGRTYSVPKEDAKKILQDIKASDLEKRLGAFYEFMDPRERHALSMISVLSRGLPDGTPLPPYFVADQRSTAVSVKTRNIQDLAARAQQYAANAQDIFAASTRRARKNGP